VRHNWNIEITSPSLCSLRSFAAKEVLGFPYFAAKERKEHKEKKGSRRPILRSFHVRDISAESFKAESFSGFGFNEFAANDFANHCLPEVTPQA